MCAAFERRATAASFGYRHHGNLATIGGLAAVLELRRFRLWAHLPGGSGALPMFCCWPSGAIVPQWC
jgi:hypothetical protein